MNINNEYLRDALNINDENEETIYSSFKKIAKSLMNDYKIIVNDSTYRIIECEFYYKSERHNDPYVHNHIRQKESKGEWYLHPSGLDITLGNENGAGGILIRGIVKVPKEIRKPDYHESVDGPLNVCTEIFKSLGSVDFSTNHRIGLVNIIQEKLGANMPTATVFALPRINLNPLKDSQDRFCNRTYRFASFLNLKHTQKEKMKQYLTVDSKEKITIEAFEKYYKGLEI